MSSLKQKTAARPASKDHPNRIQEPGKKSRLQWRHILGSKAALDLAYGFEELEERDFLPDLVVGHVRRKSTT